MHCSSARCLGNVLPIRNTVRRTCVRTLAVLAPVEKSAPAPGEARASSAAPSPLNKQAVLASQQVASTSGRVIVEKPEELKSTWEHRAWVGGTTLLLAGIFASGLSEVHDTSSAAVLAVSALTSYVAADFGSAVFHWAVDNYGDGNTPVFGSQIAAFQGHHQRPWTITEREFCNNVHQVFKPAAPFAAALLAVSPFTPAWWDVWSSTFILLVCMSQQFHAWSHMKKSELSPLVATMQDAGLLISRKDHGAHHRAPFTARYSIVSGVVNPWLDGETPEASFWRKLETFIRDRSGVEPRCWHEPDYAWVEQERPTA